MESKQEIVVDQVCPTCGGEKFRMYHYLRKGHHDRMYMECTQCGRFVGRIIVHAFVDPEANADFRAFLKAAELNDNSSARKTLEDFHEHSKRAKAQFQHVKDSPKEKTSAEKTIRDWFSEFNIREDG